LVELDAERGDAVTWRVVVRLRVAAKVGLL
jgi:hypothetical protein